MDFNQININNIIIDKDYNIRYKNSKNEIKPLLIKSPELISPFGLDKEYNNYYIKAQLRKDSDINLNNQKKLFLKFIENLETIFKEKLGKEINSQIRYSKNYDPIITLKMITFSNKISTEVKKGNVFFNIFSLPKNSIFISEIIIDKLWIYNDIIYYKIKLKKINISV